MTYLTKDHSSWVLHVPSWHPVSAADFERMWNLHPPSLGQNSFQGRSVQTPRYFRAFGRSYSFSGQVAEAFPLEEAPLAETARQKIEAQLLEVQACGKQPEGVRQQALGDSSVSVGDRCIGSLPPTPNGVLVNWYLASHSIGLHRDDTRELVPYAPIWSISWGHPRLFCLRPRCDSKCTRKVRSSNTGEHANQAHRGCSSKVATDYDASGHRELELVLNHGDLLIMCVS